MHGERKEVELMEGTSEALNLACVKCGKEFETKIISRKMFETEEKYFKKLNVEPFEEPEIINVFYSDKAYVNAQRAPNTTIHAHKLKDSIRKTKKT